MKKIIFIILIPVLFIISKKSFSQDYSKLENKYNLNLLDSHGKEMKSKVLIPEKNKKFVREFLTTLDGYNSSVNETYYLNKINCILQTFSDYRIKISGPLGSKDPINDKILLLFKEKEIVTDGGERINNSNLYAIFKIKSRWTITKIYYNYVENYRNLFSAIGNIDPSGSSISTNGNGGEFLYIIDIFRNSKGDWE